MKPLLTTLLLLAGVAGCRESERQPQNVHPDKHDSTVIQSRLFDILNDSCHRNISRAYKALGGGKIDSAYYYKGKAVAYNEMMKAQ